MTTTHPELRHSGIEALTLCAYPRGKEFPKGRISCTGAMMSQSTAGPARSGLGLSKTSLLQAPVQDQHPTVLKPPQSLSSVLLPPPYPRTGRSFIHHRLAKTHFELIVLYFPMEFPYSYSLWHSGRGRDPFSSFWASLLTWPLNSPAPSVRQVGVGNHNKKIQET